MPDRDREYMKIAKSKWRRLNESREKEGRMTLRNWNRMCELQVIIWKLAGDDGTFGEYIQKSAYKDSLLDRFFTVSDRLLKTWREMKLTDKDVTPDGARLRDLQQRDTRKKFPLVMEGQSFVLAEVQEDDDDATIAHSNCLSDK